MAKNPTEAQQRLVNGTFFIPDGVLNYAYEDTVIGDEDVDNSSSEADIYLTDDFDVIEDPSVLLDFPENITIVSQTLRRAPGGQQVVDVIIEVDDVDGAMNYQVQTTKM